MAGRTFPGRATALNGPYSRYVPALRFKLLTPTYDWVVRWSTREHVVKTALLDAAHLDTAERMLDVGCGTGTLAIAAKRRFPALEVVGVEPDRAILALARAKAAREGADVRFLVGTAGELPVPSGAFDRVTSSLMLHHLTSADKIRAAAEIDRVLTVKGEFHLADWVRPANAVMAALFLTVRILDGFDTTGDHAHGRLTERLRSGGLVDVIEHTSFHTPAGTISLVSARPGCHLTPVAGAE